MKKTTILFVLVLMGATGVYAQQTFDKFEVQVDGLGCPFCAYGLEKKFKEFKGIREVKIDIGTGNFSFAFPSEKSLDLKAVEEQVKKAGYTPIAASVTRADGSIEAKHESPKTSMTGVQESIATTRVAGNCEMCKARIEKTAMQQNGVVSASWDKDTKILELAYDPNTTSLEAVEKAIAKIGHDTEHHRAHKDAYDSLPGCCHYERIESVKK
jgi:copper chaperone CopZ